MRRHFLNFIIVLLLCSLATLLALYKLNYPLTGIDDANIYFVYARNLANGYGFVYNMGGERVEGFTSLLWTIVSSLAFRFSPHPELTLLIINVTILSLGITCALNYLQSEFRMGDKNKYSKFIGSGIFLMLLLTSPRYIVWNTVTLMENCLLSTLLIVTTIFVIEDHPSPNSLNFGFIPLSILLLLTRPESIVWVPLFTAVLFLCLAIKTNGVSALKVLLPSITCITITLALLTLFRLSYFGYPLPNTFYAKVSPSFIYDIQQGLNYLVKYFTSDLIAAISIIAVLGGVLHTASLFISRKVPNDGSAFLPIIAGTGLLLPVLTGGDHFGSFRFYQNIYTITLLCLFYFVQHILPQYTRQIRVLHQLGWMRTFLSFALLMIATLAIFMNQFNAWTRFVPEIENEFDVARYERRNGALIQELFSSLPNWPSIGVIASGGIKYSYSGEIVDLMGLNNTIMAHNQGERTGYKNHAAFEVATFYKLQPDIVWPKEVIESDWQYSESVVMDGWENKEGLKGLFDDSHFLTLYTYAKVSNPINPGKGYALVAWFKKDFLRSLSTNKDFHIKTYIDIP